jgi:hypothetical protein
MREGVERNRAGKARGGGSGDHSSDTRKHERGGEGRDRRQEGRCTTLKIDGGWGQGTRWYWYMNGRSASARK